MNYDYTTEPNPAEDEADVSQRYSEHDLDAIYFVGYSAADDETCPEEYSDSEREAWNRGASERKEDGSIPTHPAWTPWMTRRITRE